MKRLYVDVESVAKYVKSIIDEGLCDTCDQLKCRRVRYTCGHSVCDNCVSTVENCVLCLSPQDVSTHVHDGPLSLRLEHVSNLLNTFQKYYKVDVYRRLRLSKQLQLEKQLFPKCIQAPSKYCNTKRSSNISIKNKENIKPIILPGENTSRSDIITMENKINYVEQWLNKNEKSLSEANYNLPRKPFTDLNVNAQNVNRNKTLNKVAKTKKNKSRKKSPLKTSDSNIKHKSKLALTRIKNVAKESDEDFEKCKPIECEKNESGIVVDEILNISDTESVDKDRNAWLAVLEANERSLIDISSSCNTPKSGSDKVKNTNKIQWQSTGRVPFYKKSSLYNNRFKECANNQNTLLQNSSKTNNATITIENSSFITTIKITEIQDSVRGSVGVQTEDVNKFESHSCNFSKNSELPVNEKHVFKENHKIDSLGITKNLDSVRANLAKDVKANEKHIIQEAKGLIIEDSDSDSVTSLTQQDSLLEVTAEVHRSETEYVLSQLEEGQYEHRIRHAMRGHTPTSTDSSDKENYNPNRAKRRKLDKKHCNKKY